MSRTSRQCPDLAWIAMFIVVLTVAPQLGGCIRSHASRYEAHLNASVKPDQEMHDEVAIAFGLVGPERRGAVFAGVTNYQSPTADHPHR